MSDPTYLYDGALSTEVCDAIRCMMREYPYPIELSRFPGDRMPRMPDYPIQHEDCMGGSYVRMSARWGLVQKDFSHNSAGCFLFLYSPAEKKTVMEAVPDLVVNANPFRTQF